MCVRITPNASLAPAAGSYGLETLPSFAMKEKSFSFSSRAVLAHGCRANTHLAVWPNGFHFSVGVITVISDVIVITDIAAIAATMDIAGITAITVCPA